MKKKLVLSLLGAAAVSVSAYGQGQIWFANYINGSFLTTPISYANNNVPAGKAGLAISGASGFSADLMYSLDGGTTYSEVAGSMTPFFGNSDGDTASGAGYWKPTIVTIPNYTSGSVMFIAQAFDGSSYGTSSIFGQSAPFTVSSLATGTQPVGDFSGSNLQTFTVSAVPEPTTFALGSLGLAALWMFRRKK